MPQKHEMTDIVEKTRQEIIYAIKMRITEVTNNGSDLVQLQGVVMRDSANRYSESMKYFEIKNVFIDESGCLCGDLAGKEDRTNIGILFGKSIENLAVDDLKLVLDSLYCDRWSVEAGSMDCPQPDRRPGLSGIVTGTRSGIARMLRIGA